jgi:hypothetical protein
MREVAMIKLPVVVGLMLCEQVIIQEGTRHLTLVNCFKRLKVRGFPSPPQRFAAFAVLTDGQGRGQFELMVERLDNMDEVYSQRHEVTFNDPLRETNLLFLVGQCSFPAAGRYQAVLLADRQLIAQRAFQVFADEDQQ